MVNPENLNQTDTHNSMSEIGKNAIEETEKSKASGETVSPKKTVCMEVYPFSFEDENEHETVFKKMQSCLPYWKNLGVNAVWLAPVYPSPRSDMGYDIADYTSIDERFGTLDNFDDFVHEAHESDQKVLMDLVLNHTSTGHEWFKKALAGDPKYRKFYYFTDQPQADWHNFFDNQSAWAPVPGQENEYYLHSFHEKQADLRWFDENGELNQELLSEFQDIIDFWTKEHKVDGFRLDVPQAIDKDFNNPTRDFGVVLASDGEQSSLVVEKLFGNRPELLTTIETFDFDGSVIPRYAGPGKPIQYAMNAALVMGPKTPEDLLQGFENALKTTPQLMVAVQSHDTSRLDTSNSVLKELLKQHPDLSAVCLYMGQEVGKENPSIQEFGNKAFFDSDAQADMQLDAAINQKEQELGRQLTEEEKESMATEFRIGARANNRAPIKYLEYFRELEKQIADPYSTYNQLRYSTISWKRQDD